VSSMAFRGHGFLGLESCGTKRKRFAAPCCQRLRHAAVMRSRCPRPIRPH
jgi:hypothetical protein